MKNQKELQIEIIKNQRELQAADYEKIARMWNNLSPMALVGNVLPFLKGKDKVLDIGAGTGLVGVLLANYVESIDGLDVSEPMLRRAREKRVYRNLILADVRNLLDTLLPERQYDLVISVGMFGDYGLEEHLPEVIEVIKPGGLIAVAGTLNPGKILNQRGIEILINGQDYAYALPGGPTVNYGYIIGRKSSSP